MKIVAVTPPRSLHAFGGALRVLPGLGGEAGRARRRGRHRRGRDGLGGGFVPRAAASLQFIATLPPSPLSLNPEEPMLEYDRSSHSFREDLIGAPSA